MHNEREVARVIDPGEESPDATSALVPSTDTVKVYLLDLERAVGDEMRRRPYRSLALAVAAGMVLGGKLGVRMMKGLIRLAVPRLFAAVVGRALAVRQVTPAELDD